MVDLVDKNIDVMKANILLMSHFINVYVQVIIIFVGLITIESHEIIMHTFSKGEEWRCRYRKLVNVC